MEVGGRLNAPAALPPGKNYGTHWVGGEVGPRTGLNISGNRKIFCLFRDLHLLSIP